MSAKSPFSSIFHEFSNYPEETQDLYEELLSRHSSLRGVLKARKRTLQQNSILKTSKADTENILLNARILEATLWFLTIEFYSRFLSNPSTGNGSKRCLKKLINKLEAHHHKEISHFYDNFIDKEAEVIGYMKIQRDKYFAHADNVSWDKFPRVFDEEYERLLNEVGDILDHTGKLMDMQRATSRYS